jgi:hypothetical protein
MRAKERGSLAMKKLSSRQQNGVIEIRLFRICLGSFADYSASERFFPILVQIHHKLLREFGFLVVSLN